MTVQNSVHGTLARRVMSLTARCEASDDASARSACVRVRESSHYASVVIKPTRGDVWEATPVEGKHSNVMYANDCCCRPQTLRL